MTRFLSVLPFLLLALLMLAGICFLSAHLYVSGHETASFFTYVPGAFVAAIPLVVADRMEL